MDILEQLNEELKDKNWSIEEQARYLYIRSCELFSYDPRYDFLDSEEQEIIRNRTFDLRNVEDRRVVCTTHAREIYSEIIKELLGFDTNLMGTSHLWTKLTIKNAERVIKADATAESDIARVKMNLSTKGYLSITMDYTFQDKLKRVDQIVGYIQEEYEDSFIQSKKEELLEEFSLQKQEIKKLTKSFLYRISMLKELFGNCRDNSIVTDEFTIYQWDTIKKLFEQYQDFLDFTDAEYCVSYLENKLIGKANGWKSNTVSLYQIEEDNTWKFLNIYPVYLQKDILYFLLEQNTKVFHFHEISELDARHYTDSMNGKNKHLIKQ